MAQIVLSSSLNITITGNYTEDSIQRVAKSMNLSKVLREKLVPAFKDSEDAVHKERLGHRKADWSKQLKVVVEDIQVGKTVT